MRILVINPNTSAETTQMIDVAAKKYVFSGTEVTTVNPKEGPELLKNPYDYAMQAPKVIELVEKNRNNYDAFIIASASDPGVKACRVVARYVLWMTEAAVMTACAVARRFSFLTTSKVSALTAREWVHMFGIDQSRFASARIVAGHDVIKRRHQIFDTYCEVGQKCIEEDGAEALILYSAPIIDLKQPLEARLKVPVIDGVVSAIKIAEQLPI